MGGTFCQWWLEPFSGVEIHMEMDMEWKWSGNGAQFVKIVWIGLDLGQSVDLKPMTDIKPSQNMIKVTQKLGYIWLNGKYVPKLKD